MMLVIIIIIKLKTFKKKNTKKYSFTFAINRNINSVNCLIQKSKTYETSFVKKIFGRLYPFIIKQNLRSSF